MHFDKMNMVKRIDASKIEDEVNKNKKNSLIRKIL